MIKLNKVTYWIIVGLGIATYTAFLIMEIVHDTFQIDEILKILILFIVAFTRVDDAVKKGESVDVSAVCAALQRLYPSLLAYKEDGDLTHVREALQDLLGVSDFTPDDDQPVETELVKYLTQHFSK